MRRFLLGCTLLASGLFSLAVISVVSPLLLAMRVDRRERDHLEELMRQRWLDTGYIGYDDNDPGEDVDDDRA